MRTYYSPRHTSLALKPMNSDLGGHVCPATGGVFLAREPADRLKARFDIQPDRSGSPAQERLFCPECMSQMRAVVVRGVTIDHCSDCGALWFDGGELHTLSRGQYGDPAKGQPLPSAPPPPEAAALTTTREAAETSLACTWAHKEPGGLMIGLESLLATEQVLKIDQFKEGMEILTGFEGANKYRVADTTGRPKAWITERTRGLGGAFKRIMLGSLRTLEAEVTDPGGQQILMDLKRPFAVYFTRMEVVTPTGRRLGHMQRRFGLVNRTYDLHDDTGKLFARVRGPLWKPWTFLVIDEGGRELARISKKWSGFASEYFTDADTFAVDFGTWKWTLAQRAIILSAAISIDLDFFENNQSGQSGLIAYSLNRRR